MGNKHRDGFHGFVMCVCPLVDPSGGKWQGESENSGMRNENEKRKRKYIKNRKEGCLASSRCLFVVWVLACQSQSQSQSQQKQKQEARPTPEENKRKKMKNEDRDLRFQMARSTSFLNLLVEVCVC